MLSEFDTSGKPSVERWNRMERPPPCRTLTNKGTPKFSRTVRWFRQHEAAFAADPRLRRSTHVSKSSRYVGIEFRAGCSPDTADGSGICASVITKNWARSGLSAGSDQDKGRMSWKVCLRAPCGPCRAGRYHVQCLIRIISGASRRSEIRPLRGCFKS